MTLGLSPELEAAFGRAGSAVLVTLDGAGHPVATTSRVEHDAGAGCFGLDVALGLPDARAALVLADGVEDHVLVQGTARPAGAMGVQVRPERVYRWTGGDLDAEPELYDAHLEEVRSAHNQEPEVPHEPPTPEAGTWESRLDALAALTGARGTLAVVGPDGFPFAVVVPVAVDPAAGRVVVHADPVGAPLEPGPACLLVLDAEARELLVHGDLLEEDARWVLRPRAL